MFNGVQIKKDPIIDQLTTNAFGQMREILEKECPEETCCSFEEIKFVSFEDALKELVALKTS
jgi:hypothetical protein